MTPHSELARLFEKTDREFFAAHPDRKSHIRKCYSHEHEAEFQTLGLHERSLRRILLTRVDFERNPLPEDKVLKIPFLLNDDEQIADTDEALLPIIEDVMRQEMGGVQ